MMIIRQADKTLIITLVAVTVFLILSVSSYAQTQLEIVGALGYELANPCELAVNDADKKYKTYDGSFDLSYFGYYGGRYINWNASKFHLFCYGGMLAAIQIDFDELSDEFSIKLYNDVITQLVRKYGDFTCGEIDQNQQLIPVHTLDEIVVMKQFGLVRNNRSIFVVLLHVKAAPDKRTLSVLYWDNSSVKLMLESSSDY